MPIRFRCAYCNQLMGIAHRKAGTVVRCPNCAGQVVVPRPENAASAPDTVKPGDEARPPLFERHDFEEALSSAAGGAESGDSASQVVPPPLFSGKTFEPAYNVDRLDFPTNLPKPTAPPGIFLSRMMVTILIAALILLLTAVFTVGLLVGRSLNPPPREEQAAHANVLPREVVRHPGLIW
jgi:phage FluMu protein Com